MMIVTKGANQVSGYIEYSYDFDYRNPAYSDISDDDRDTMFESDTFDSLSDLLNKMKPEVLNEIKENYDAEKVWISCISFKAQSEDGKTSADISMFESGKRGHVATEVENEDITDRAFLNMQKIKQIVDNTINQYPVKY